MSRPEATIEEAADRFREGRYRECRRLCVSLLEGRPGDAELHQIAAAACLQQGQVRSARRHLRQAIAWEPADARFPAALAELCLASGRVRGALAWAERARALAPDDLALLSLYARCCLAAGKHRPAIEVLKDRAVDEGTRKLLGRAYAYEGRARAAEWRHGEAAEAFEKSLEYDGGHIAVLSNLGGAYVMAGAVDAGLACFRRAIELDPAFLTARSNLLLCLHYASGHSPAEIAREHRKQGRAWEQAAPCPPRKRGPGKRIRIGYVSSEFRSAPVAKFMEAILQSYDRRRFHVTCYYSAPVVDVVTRRFKRLPDRWREIVELDDLAAARQIREDGCDILVDLNGHTHGNRLGIFALRPARVQATYLGYPDTTGLAAIDYRITDEICDPPPDADRNCVEKLIRVPECFLCYRPPRGTPRVGSLPADTNGTITFGCFNQLAKLSEETIRLWAQVLDATPGSRLLLKAGSLCDGRIAESIRERFAVAGIDPARLELRGRTQSEWEHLATYGEVDVALDPFPYGGTTTTCESLWMGVPVITLLGKSHAARVGASLLRAVGMTRHIAGSKQEYSLKVGEMAANREDLRRTRRELRKRMKESVLCDEDGFVKRFEGMLMRLWRGGARS